MKWIICAIALACLGGCSIKEQVVRVSVPDARANPEQGALVQVNPVQDDRQASFLAKFPASTWDKNVGGFVRGGRGMSVVLESTTTTQKVHSIIVQALRNMGYRTVASCDASCMVVTPVLNSFAVTLSYNFWRAATYSQHMLADITVQVALRDHGHTSTFDAKGHGSNVYQFVSQENWEIALNKAVKDFVADFQQQMLSHTGPAAANSTEPIE